MKTQRKTLPVIQFIYDIWFVGMSVKADLHIVEYGLSISGLIILKLK